MAFCPRIKTAKGLNLYKLQLQRSCSRLPVGLFKQDKRLFSDLPPSVNDKPVKFTTSQAAGWKADQSRSGSTQGAPEAQTYVVTLSTAIFLYYFLVLREENDMDEMLTSNIYEKIEGLEEIQLRGVYNYNLDNGIDNTAVVARLRELEEMKSKS